MQDQVSILDCTLRDGGYYNNWLFDDSLVSDYLRLCSVLKIDYCELGLRQPKYSNIFHGPSAYTSDYFLNNLNIPTNLKISILTNYSYFDGLDNEEANNLVDQLFPSSDLFKIDLLRITFDIDHLVNLNRILPLLRGKATKIAINIMKISDFFADFPFNTLKTIDPSLYDLIYIADSFGGCFPDDITRLVQHLYSSLGKPVGIHAHNNYSLAIANTLSAIQAGASWIDSTFLGMGRGPGNAQTELILPILDKLNIKKTDDNLYPEIEKFLYKHMRPLKSTHSWGPSLPYSYSAAKSIHPTAVQNILQPTNYMSSDVFYSLKSLSKHDSDVSIYPTVNSCEDISSINVLPGSQLHSSPFLILGNGPSSKDHASALVNYINKHNPVLISLNTISYLPPSLVDYIAVSHPLRLASEFSFVSEHARVIISPISLQNYAPQNPLLKYINYGLYLSKDYVSVFRDHCILPYPYVFGYALAYALSSGASKISFFGVDGFNINDQRHDDHLFIYNKFSEMEDLPSIETLIPSSLPFKLNSIYCQI